MARLNYDDILKFQTCPLILKNFNHHSSYFTDREKLIAKCITRVFFNELVTEGNPSKPAINTYWGQILSPLKNGGIDLKSYNNYTISLTQMYESYVEEIFNKQFATVGVDIDVELEYEGAYYFSVVPAIVVNKHKKVIPVFYSINKGQSTTMDNYIRFAAAALQNMTGVQITDYILIHILNADAPLKFSLKMYHLKFNEDEIHRSTLQLKTIIKQITKDHPYPNTSHCKNCDFIRKCIL